MEHKHLVDAHELGVPAIPEAVFNWLKEIPLLKGIPFHYLIADERLLPIDSIRFFQINWQWIWAFIDGAFSLVRSPQQVEKDELMHLAITKLGLNNEFLISVVNNSSHSACVNREDITKQVKAESGKICCTDISGFIADYFVKCLYVARLVIGKLNFRNYIILIGHLRVS